MIIKQSSEKKKLEKLSRSDSICRGKRTDDFSSLNPSSDSSSSSVSLFFLKIHTSAVSYVSFEPVYTLT